MAPEFNTLAQHCDSFLKASSFRDNAVNGVQVASQRRVRKLALAVSASLAATEETVQEGCDALLVHHGLFWSGSSYVISGTRQKALRLLLENDIGLLAYHLPLDAHPQVGNNWGAFRELGFTGLESFGPYNGQDIGVRGLSGCSTFAELLAKLEGYYGQKAHVAQGAGAEKAQKVGLVSGGAYKSLHDAVAAGLDCFITGSFDEPVWHWAHEEQINFIAVGHSASETVGPRRLGAQLSELFGLETHFCVSANPF